MNGFALCVTLLSIFSVIIGPVCGMSRAALKKSGKMTQKTCMPKNNVDISMVGEIEQGKFIEDPNVMCYIACVYQMSGMVKGGKLDYDASVKQVNTLFPPELKGPTIAAMDACKPVAKKYSKDLCKSSYYTAECIYKHDPENFFFA